MGMEESSRRILSEVKSKSEQEPEGFEIAKTFRTAHDEHGFIQVHAIGDRGTGKTTFGMQLGEELYGSFDKALKYFIVDLDPLWPLLREYLDKGKRIRYLILDDVGRIIGRYTQFIRGGYARLKAVAELWEQLRSLSSGIYMTSTKPNVVKPIMEANTHGAKVYKQDHARAQIKIWSYSEEWWGKPWWTPEYMEDFYLYLPPDIRSAVEQKRQSSLKEALETCQKAFSKESKQLNTQPPQPYIPKSKVDGEDVLRRLKAGETYAQMSARFGVSPEVCKRAAYLTRARKEAEGVA